MHTLPARPQSSIIKVLASRHSSSSYGELVNYDFSDMTYTTDAYEDDEE